MKALKIKLARQSLALFGSMHPVFLLTWMEQVGAWLVATGIDWAKLPWAFAGATIATLKSKKDSSGQAVHKPFWEYVSSPVGGTVIALAGWKDVEKFTGLSPELSTIIAGLVGWILADIVIKMAKNKLASNDLTPKP